MDSALFEANLKQRKELYLELSTANVFRLGNISLLKPGLYPDTRPLAPDTFVLCDVYGAKNVALGNGKIVKAGLPILYYRANASEKTIRGVYSSLDNDAVVLLKEQEDHIRNPSIPGTTIINPLANPAGSYAFFYDYYIKDPKITAWPWPYKSDSFILISAGADGIYGTPDDIRNFAD
jgi:hypothetical protein